ncbi:MAG TPA: hypothetical protein VGC42_22605 [Kofleriaceae bacterium]
MIASVALALACVTGAAGLAHADPRPAATASAAPKPSGVLKAYKGPEGEIIAMVEVNDGKQILVYFKNLGGELDGKSMLYQLEDLGHGDKNVFINKKRGSKTYRSNLLSARENDWSFYHPSKPGTEFRIRYSEQATGELKVDDVVKAYRP